MAYNYFPQYYNSPFLQVPGMQPPAQSQPMQQMQQGGRNIDFVLVRSEEEAKNYPVAYGNTVTFKNENMPYMYTKTMGFSQLDRPIFDKYKLVKEQTEETVPTQKTDPKFADLESEIGRIWQAIDDLKKKEVDEGV